MTEAETTIVNDYARRRFEVQFDIRRSVRYHDLRRDFFSRSNQILLFVNLVLGSGGIALYFWREEIEWFPPLAYCVIAIISAVLIAFRVSECGALHAKLYERFIRLEKEVFELSDGDTAGLARLESEFLEISIYEPAVFRALNRICHNQVVRSEGCGEQYIQPLLRRHHFFKNFVKFQQLPTKPS